MENIIIKQPYNASVEETLGITKSATSRFIEANTVECSLDDIRNSHIIPVFAKDNESTISHTEFIEAVNEVATYCFSGLQHPPSIRVSHPIKGRVPEAKGKAVQDLQEHEKTLYYERMAFMVEVPSVRTDVEGNELTLTVGGVKAYNLDNLNSKVGTDQHFKVFIGFKNSVCTNLCISTDGFTETLKVKGLKDLYDSVYNLFNSFQAQRQVDFLRGLGNNRLTEQQFVQLIGRARLYQFLPPAERRKLEQLKLSDTQINLVASAYVQDVNFARAEDGSVSLWQLYNLFTGANKASYIDQFLDRGVNCAQFTHSIKQALDNNHNHWFLN